MTGGYLIALGPGVADVISAPVRDRLEALGYRQAFAEEDFGIFATQPGAVRAAPGLGVIVGTLRPRRKDGVEPSDLVALLSQAWGAYVAVLLPHDRPKSVFRDPSGAVPAFWFRLGETLIVTDQVDLGVQLDLLSPRVNWDFLLQDLVFRRRRGVGTGIVGVAELAPGENLAVGAMPTLAWSPWRFTDARLAFRDLDEAADALRAAVELSVQGSALDYRALSLELSGGLDSSIVAVSLPGDRRLSAFNILSQDAEGDERAFAIDVAEAAGFPLTFKTLDPQSVRLDSSSAYPRPARPGRLGTLSPLNDALTAHARAVGAEAFIGGMGGDSVFFYTNSAAPVADRLLRQGLKAGAVRTALDVARMNNATIWAVAKRAWRLVLRPDLDPHRGANYSFLTPQAPISADVHPWMAARPRGVLPGQQRHVASIAYIAGFLDGHVLRDGFPQLSPLLAQPVVETALRTPSWLSVDQGRDRAVARAAFRDLLPASVLHRRSKGAIDRFVHDAVLASIPEMSGILLDGLLARQGLLDVSAVEQALARSDDLAGARGQRLLALADAEYWARAWSRLD